VEKTYTCYLHVHGALICVEASSYVFLVQTFVFQVLIIVFTELFPLVSDNQKG
jgi:hypothetical protein